MKGGSAYTLAITTTDGLYVDEPNLSIRWDSVHQHVHTEWKGFANSAELRAGMLKGIRAIRDNSAVACVNDTREIKVIVHEDQKWIKETWLPRAIDAGLKRIAFVTAATGLAKLNVEDVAGLVDGDRLQSGTFDSIANARNWVAGAHVGPQ